MATMTDIEIMAETGNAVRYRTEHGETIEVRILADDGRYQIADLDGDDRWRAIQISRLGGLCYSEAAEGDTWDGPDGTHYTATRTDNAGSIRWRAD